MDPDLSMNADPLTYSAIDRVMIAKVIVDSTLDNINPSEISKKVDDILNSSITDPLYVNLNDVDVIYHALRNRVMNSDILTNPNSALMLTVNQLATDNWNRQIEFIRRREAERVTTREIISHGVTQRLPDVPRLTHNATSAGSRIKRKRKQTKRKMR